MPTVDPALHDLMDRLADLACMEAFITTYRQSMHPQDRAKAERLLPMLLESLRTLNATKQSWYQTYLLDATLGELDTLSAETSELLASD